MQPSEKNSDIGYMTIAEAASVLGVTPATLRNWDRAGKLKPERHPVNGYRIYRQEELQRILLPNESRDEKSDSVSLFDLAQPGNAEHFVQFYEDTAHLAASVSAFIGAGLRQDEAGVIIATPEHRAAIDKELAAAGIDPVAARKQGRYLCLDAAETLEQLMTDGRLDPLRFQQVVGTLMAQLTKEYGHIRAFGEMVAILWAEGNPQAAIRLEELWNELIAHEKFTLFCAYPLQAFADVNLSDSFDHVCRHHSKVMPMQDYAALRSDDDRLRAIAKLQQRALSLEAEIAHRREVEKSLLKREQELSGFFESAAEGIHKVGPDGMILWANRAEMELLGYEPAEYIGQHIAKFHADAAAIEHILRRLSDGETLLNQAAKLRCKDGSIKHVLINSNAFWQDGKFLYTRCFTRDISDRILAEESQFLLSAVVESSQDAIISKDLNSRILSWNRAAEQLFGYTAAEAIGQSITMLIPPERINEEHGIIERLKRGERIEHYETIRQSKSGRLIDISLMISPVRDAEGHIIGASKVARDISEQKRLQKILQDALQQAQSASIAKTEFLANMSHELRTPLNAVIGLASLLQSKEMPREQRQEFLGTLHLSAQQLLRLINDLLDISRLETEKLELEHIPFDIQEVIAEIVTIHSLQAKEKGIELVRLGTEAKLQVVGDPFRFNQILMNLLGNALKFTQRGRITIGLEYDEHSHGEEADIKLTVADTGVGIAEESLESIFGKFTQADTSTTRQYGGTGLGLTITKTLVELMGGTIEVKSKLGEGSCFTIHISLPKNKASVPTVAAEQPATASEAAGCYVLLVEDYPANLLVAGTMLNMLGCRYEIARTGKEALEKIKQQVFDCVLMDVQMPEMDGFQATQLLREWEAKTGRAPTLVIGMTAHALKGDRERCLDAGMDDYISKPFLQEELEEKLKQPADAPIP